MDYDAILIAPPPPVASAVASAVTFGYRRLHKLIVTPGPNSVSREATHHPLPFPLIHIIRVSKRCERNRLEATATRRTLSAEMILRRSFRAPVSRALAADARCR